VFWISGTRMSYEEPIDREAQDEPVAPLTLDVTPWDRRGEALVP